LADVEEIQEGCVALFEVSSFILTSSRSDFPWRFFFYLIVFFIFSFLLGNSTSKHLFITVLTETIT